MSNSTICKGVTLGVNSVRGSSLLMCLTSVATSSYVPEFVRVRLEGSFSNLSDFYLEQISDVFRLLGSEISFTRCASKGVRYARDWQLETCSTDYLWAVDEDVIVEFSCLDYLKRATSKDKVLVCGSKLDVNNRREYRDYDSSLQSSLLYKGTGFRYSDSEVREILFADTGNCLFYTPICKNFKFSVFPDSANCGGEDTLYSLVLRSKGYSIWHSLAALGYHLEKPSRDCFSEFESRKEQLLRACDVLGLNKSLLQDFLKR